MLCCAPALLLQRCSIGQAPCIDCMCVGLVALALLVDTSNPLGQAEATPLRIYPLWLCGCRCSKAGRFQPLAGSGKNKGTGETRWEGRAWNPGLRSCQVIPAMVDMGLYNRKQGGKVNSLNSLYSLSVGGRLTRPNIDCLLWSCSEKGVVLEVD